MALRHKVSSQGLLPQLKDIRLPAGQGTCCYVMPADTVGCAARDAARFLPGLLYLPALGDSYLKNMDFSDFRACLLLTPLCNWPAQAKDCDPTFKACRELVEDRSGGPLGMIIVVILVDVASMEKHQDTIQQLHAASFAAGADNVLVSCSGAAINQSQLLTAVLTAESWHERLAEAKSREAYQEQKWGQKYKAGLRKLIWSTPHSVFPHIPQEDPTLLEEESRVGEFEFIRAIGQGGFGTVHLVKHGDQGRKAIKLIKKASIKRISDLAHVEQELRILRGVLDHPNVLKVHCCLHGKANIYIVMAYLGKYNLHAYILLKQRGSRRNPSMLTIDEVLGIFGHVIKALAHCHDSHICHRDIKCKNLMIDSDGHVTLIDFGLAVQVAVDQTLHECVGSLPFVAPEVLVCTNENGYSGFCSDVWSLGVLLQELVCGLGSSDELIGLPPGESDLPTAELAEKCQSMSTCYTQELAMSIAGSDITGARRTGLATAWRGMFQLDPPRRLSIRSLAALEVFAPHVGALCGGSSLPAPMVQPTPELGMGEGGKMVRKNAKRYETRGPVGSAATLLDRLGGSRVVNKVVVASYDLLLPRPEFAKFFLACPLKMGRIRSGIGAFLEVLFSNPEQCDLAQLDEVHQSHNITDGLFSEFADILLDAFHSEASSQDIFEIQQNLETLRSSITSGYRARLAVAQGSDKKVRENMFSILGKSNTELAQFLRQHLSQDAQIRSSGYGEDSFSEKVLEDFVTPLVRGDIDGAARAAFGEHTGRSVPDHLFVSLYCENVKTTLLNTGMDHEEVGNIALQLEHEGERIVRAAHEPQRRGVRADAETEDWFVRTLMQLCLADPFLQHFAEMPGMAKCAKGILGLATAQDGSEKLEKIREAHKKMTLTDERFRALLAHVGAVLRALFPWPAYPASVCSGALRSLQSVRTDVLRGSTLQMQRFQSQGGEPSNNERRSEESGASAEVDSLLPEQVLMQEKATAFFRRLQEDPRLSAFFRNTETSCIMRKADVLGRALSGKKLSKEVRAALRGSHERWNITHYHFDCFCEHVRQALKDDDPKTADDVASNLERLRGDIVGKERSRCPVTGAMASTGGGCPFGKAPLSSRSTQSQTPVLKQLGGEGALFEICDAWEREMIVADDFPMVTNDNQLKCKAKVRRFLLAVAGDSCGNDMAMADIANAEKAREAHQGLGMTPQHVAASLACFDRAMASYGVSPQVAGVLAKTLDRLATTVALPPAMESGVPTPVVKWPTLDASKLEKVKEHLGGEAGLNSLIEAWCSKMLEEPAISPFFAGARNRMKMFQTAFWTEVLRGHVPMDGTAELRLMKVHDHLRISSAHFDAFVGCLTDACQERGVSQSITNALRTSVESFRYQVVNVREG